MTNNIYYENMIGDVLKNLWFQFTVDPLIAPSFKSSGNQKPHTQKQRLDMHELHVSVRPLTKK